MELIKKKIALFELIAKNGKLQGTPFTSKNTYRIMNKWERLGLVTVEKVGRTNEVILTKKGQDYYNNIQNIKEYLDIFS